MNIIDASYEFTKQLNIEINSQAIENKHTSDLEKIEIFSSAAFKKYNKEELSRIPAPEAYKIAIGLWEFIKEFNKKSTKVEIKTQKKEYGNKLAHHTAITILNSDTQYLVDSIRLVLNKRKININNLKSTQLEIDRDKDNKITKITKITNNLINNETLITIDIDTINDRKILTELKNEIISTLDMIRSVSIDTKEMEKKLIQVGIELEENKHINESELISWLDKDKYILFGYSYTNNTDTKVTKHNLGLYKTHLSAIKNNINNLKEKFTREAIVFSKSSLNSHIHIDSPYDIISIPVIDSGDNIVGEHQIIGIFTHKIKTISPNDIPWLRQKIRKVLALSNVTASSHDSRKIIRIIDDYPKDELFQCEINYLFNSTTNLIRNYDKKIVNTTSRTSNDNLFSHFNIYIPKESFSNNAVLKIQEKLEKKLNRKVISSDVSLSESVLARLYFTFFNSENNTEIPKDHVIENIISATIKTWEDRLLSALKNEHGIVNGGNVYLNYKLAFPSSYREEFNSETTIQDIEIINELSETKRLSLKFYYHEYLEKKELRLKLFNLSNKLELSSMIPILENMGFKVIGENPYKVTPINDNSAFIHDFELVHKDQETFKITKYIKSFEESFQSIWDDLSENDSFNRLVINARLNWREVNLLRAYSAYLKQIEFSFNKDSIARTLSDHPKVTRDLVALFKMYFHPTKNNINRANRINKRISASIDIIDNLNEDITLRQLQCLINSTLRTNFFQQDNNGNIKNYLSLKLSPRTIPEMPSPKPEFEIFIYSPELEGTHLRGGKISRGGLRWSNRTEDYRTEILGLVKAQQVKNSLIVPQGAKGGFVIKKTSPDEDLALTAKKRYITYIRGLLDITDNLCGDSIVTPKNTVIRDDLDPYLVVAADKGTSHLSDTANEVAAEYDFWLGDAFASGGSKGYDHKAIGITAKGAWIAVQRHFLEMNTDIQKEKISVVGIGDMGGDVFGNGMLMSKHISLIAAFNHQHIFIDPAPDREASYAERSRIFNLQKSTWADYNAKHLSKGGAIYSRNSKKIELSSQIQKILNITEKILTPNELITKILKAEVDLIWNGGIGTYIKSSSEAHSAAGDKSNDHVRISADQLKCKVLGEGGNLGITQKGRIEFCLHGGVCNTDFIDNAAGVDCSDNEVNIKILLDDEVRKERLSINQRNDFLSSMTNKVSKLVLNNSYRQSLAISLALEDCRQYPDEYIQLINELESNGQLSRELEFIPTDSEIEKRYNNGLSLTRPEIAVLLSYTKATIKASIVNSNLPEMSLIARIVESSFPDDIVISMKEEINSHKLYKELVATQITNDMVNSMGMTFYHHMHELTGKSLREIALVYLIAREVWGLPELLDDIKQLNFSISHKIQEQLTSDFTNHVKNFVHEILMNKNDIIISDKGLLMNKNNVLICDDDIILYKQQLNELLTITPSILSDNQSNQWSEKYEALIENGVPKEMAMKYSSLSIIKSPINIIQSTKKYNSSIHKMADAIFQLRERLNLDWLYRHLHDKHQLNHWQRLNRQLERAAMDKCISTIAGEICVLSDANESKSINMDTWTSAYPGAISRWDNTSMAFTDRHISNHALLSLAIRDLEQLAKSVVLIIR